MSTQRRSPWILGACAGLLAGAALAVEPGSFVAEVPEAFVVDGQEFPAGHLTIRQRAAFTPVRVLDTVDAGPTSAGMLMARVAEAETVSDDVVLFRRDDSGRLVLIGYALATPDGGRSYRYSVDGPVATAVPAELAVPLVATR